MQRHLVHGPSADNPYYFGTCFRRSSLLERLVLDDNTRRSAAATWLAVFDLAVFVDLLSDSYATARAILTTKYIYGQGARQLEIARQWHLCWQRVSELEDERHDQEQRELMEEVMHDHGARAFDPSVRGYWEADRFSEESWMVPSS